VPVWARGNPVPSDLYAFDDGFGAAAASARVSASAASDAGDWTARVGGADVKRQLDHGYLAITREWRDGDVVELNFHEPVRAVRANENVTPARGHVAFERGPVVYCVEDVDYSGVLAGLTVPASAKIGVDARKLLGGLEVLTIDGAKKAGAPAQTLTAIPYFAWNNRGNAPMAVWLKRE
jgi:DUF1680 family protein